MKPNSYLMQAINVTMGGAGIENSTYTTVKYFMTCDGTNPMDTFADIALSFANQLNDSLTQIYSNSSYTPQPVQCYHNNDVLNALNLMPTIYADINHLFEQLECDGISENLYSLIDVGLCDYSFTGLFIIWLGVFAFSVVLFFLNFNAGILFQYFDPLMWSIGSSSFELLPPVTELLYDENNTSEQGLQMQVNPTAPSVDLATVPQQHQQQQPKVAPKRK